MISSEFGYVRAPHFIGGEWVSGEGPDFESVNPATGLVFWKGSSAGTETISHAVDSARTAFEAWKRRTFEERVAYVRAFASLMETSVDSLAAAISRDVGKPPWEAKIEVRSMIAKCEISIEAHQKRCAERSAGGAVTRFRPHGVVCVLGPFNFPGHLPNGHIMPALLAGNTVVFKPSDKAPHAAEEMMGLWQKSGLPAGVLNMVQGGVATAQSLVDNPDVRGIFFTGSSKAGIFLNQRFAGLPGKILALEMGGNNPLVVHDPGDVKSAALLASQSAFISAGQRCSCARRLIVTGATPLEDFLGQLVLIARTMRVGTPEDELEPFCGPLISSEAAETFIEKQEALRSAGAQPLLEGIHLKPGTGLVSPAIWDVTGIEGVPDEEIFAPLLQVIRVRDLDEAIREANATQYGLAAGILSRDRAAYETFLEGVRAGLVNWNQPLPGASSAAPFGGIGMSGNHRPGAYLAADYCSHPVASMEADLPAIPKALPPGLFVE
jgi:succinylglutamic semialdehyde dehydrogenase